MIAQSAAMKRTLSIIRRVAPSRSTVLITGESGTGKERVAHYIHQNSPRAEGPFIRVNCAALSEQLLESDHELAHKILRSVVRVLCQRLRRKRAMQHALGG